MHGTIHSSSCPPGSRQLDVSPAPWLTYTPCQTGGRRVFESRELARIDRERLLQAGFLRPALKGWLLSSSPRTQDGESTPWHASFWEFCARYCEKRFKNRWHLSPEQSLQHF